MSWATNKDETLSFEMSECFNLSFQNMLNVKSKFFQEFDLVAFYFEIEEVHEFLKVGYAYHYNAKKEGNTKCAQYVAYTLIGAIFKVFDFLRWHTHNLARIYL